MNELPLANDGAIEMECIRKHGLFGREPLFARALRQIAAWPPPNSSPDEVMVFQINGCIFRRKRKPHASPVGASDSSNEHGKWIVPLMNYD